MLHSWGSYLHFNTYIKKVYFKCVKVESFSNEERMFSTLKGIGFSFSYWDRTARHCLWLWQIWLWGKITRKEWICELEKAKCACVCFDWTFEEDDRKFSQKALMCRIHIFWVNKWLSYTVGTAIQKHIFIIILVFYLLYVYITYFLDNKRTSINTFMQFEIFFYHNS